MNGKALFAATLLAVITTPSIAASVNCPPSSSHPVCKANYAAYPRGTLKEGQRSSGTATVDGKTVNWVCLGGTSSSPRVCAY
jgi:hypothetical protein